MNFAKQLLFELDLAGVLSVARIHVGNCTPPEERVTYMSWLGIVQVCVSTNLSSFELRVCFAVRWLRAHSFDVSLLPPRLLMTLFANRSGGNDVNFTVLGLHFTKFNFGTWLLTLVRSFPLAFLS